MREPELAHFGCRYTEKEGPDGMMSADVRPYLMDLGSTNGCFLNGERLETQRYYELYEKVSPNPLLDNYSQRMLHGARAGTDYV